MLKAFEIFIPNRFFIYSHTTLHLVRSDDAISTTGKSVDPTLVSRPTL